MDGLSHESHPPFISSTPPNNWSHLGGIFPSKPWFLRGCWVWTGDGIIYRLSTIHPVVQKKSQPSTVWPHCELLGMKVDLIKMECVFTKKNLKFPLETSLFLVLEYWHSHERCNPFKVTKLIDLPNVKYDKSTNHPVPQPFRGLIYEVPKV